MTKTVRPVLKRAGAVLLAAIVFVLMAVPALAVTLSDAPTGYVYDGANVLSSSTESYIERTGSALSEACGAEIVVATVDFTDGEDIADYAYDLFNKWGIGDKKKNNGLLILLSIGAEDYYAEPGSGLTDVFTGGVLDAMLYDYLEDDFAAKNYDSGVKKVYARAAEILEEHYNVSLSGNQNTAANTNSGYTYNNGSASGGFFNGIRRVVNKIGRFIIIILFIFVMVLLSARRPRYRYRNRWGAPPPPPPPGGFGGFWRGPRPPRGPGPGGFGGFGGGPRPGGFSGSSRPSGGSRPGGGRTGGFGSGRSGGGAPRSGGGSTHGGGAGRRR